MDLQLKDRFSSAVEPREWFLVPLQTIEMAIEKLIEGTLANYRYDVSSAQLIEQPKEAEG